MPDSAEESQKSHPTQIRPHDLVKTQLLPGPRYCVLSGDYCGDMAIDTITKFLDGAHVPSDILLSGLGCVVAVRNIVSEVDQALHAKP